MIPSIFHQQVYILLLLTIGAYFQKLDVSISKFNLDGFLRNNLFASSPNWYLKLFNLSKALSSAGVEGNELKLFWKIPSILIFISSCDFQMPLSAPVQ